MCPPYCTMYTVQCTVYSVRTVYTVQCTLVGFSVSRGRGGGGGCYFQQENSGMYVCVDIWVCGMGVWGVWVRHSTMVLLGL